MVSIHRSVACRALLLVCMLALSARAQTQSSTRAADEHAARGEKLFVAGRYPEAIDELRAAFIVTGQPRFLYALGQAYRANHQCVEAVQAYRDFVHANPSTEQTAAANERIKLCGEEDPASLATPLSPETPLSVTPQPIPTAPPPAVAAHAPLATVEMQAAPPPHKAIYKRWWLWTTVGVVAVGLGVGLGVGLTRGGFSPTVPRFGPGLGAGN